MPTDSRQLSADTESESDDEIDCAVGAQAPPLTKQISNILNRYPEGGQILKVGHALHYKLVCMYVHSTICNYLSFHSYSGP